MSLLLTLMWICAILYVSYNLDKTIKALQKEPFRFEIRVLTAPEENPEDIPVAPLPKEVQEYINAESDEWARAARGTMARKYFAKLESWDAVLHQLKIEDRME